MALKSIKALALASLAAGPAAAAYDCSTSKAGCTPLDDYVNAPDSTYKWEDLNITLDGPGWTAYVVNMTSQSWLTSADWDFAPRDDGSRAGASPVWWHYLAIIVPHNYGEKAPASWGGLWITGGSNTDSAPKVSDEDMMVAGAFATGSGVIMGALFQVPDEHIIFTSDPLQQSRTEDAIIAFTWDHFVTKPNGTSEPEWLLRLPMTKAAVRAMDTIEAWVEQDPQGAVREKLLSSSSGGGGKEGTSGGAVIDSWLVAGASKRGWTTWTLAAVAPDRVKFAVPVVLDVLNLVENMHHQWRAFGGWTWAFKDYYAMNFTAEIDDPNTQLMLDVVDPYAYFDRLEGLPKFVCNTGMDEFMQIDDDHYWWDALPEPKRRLIMPNTEHSCATGIFEIVPAAVAMANQVIVGDAVPEPTWELAEGAESSTITVYAGEKYSGGFVPRQVVMWSAPSDCEGTRRDWRIVTGGPAQGVESCSCGLENSGQCLNLKSFWSSTTLEEDPDRPGVYVATQPAPESGWTAFFVDITYDPTAYGGSGGAAKDTADAAYEEALLALAGSDGPVDLASVRAGIAKARAANLLPQQQPEQPEQPEQQQGRRRLDWPLDNRHIDFTTQAAIVPNTFPYEDCVGEDCYGTLL